MKMSKSHEDPRSRILITDPASEIERKVRAALTDSEPGISFEPVRRPGLANLLYVVSTIQGGGLTPSELALGFQNQRMSTFKSHVASCIANHFQEIRERYLEHWNRLEHGSELHEMTAKGAREANSSAAHVLEKVYDKTGIR